MYGLLGAGLTVSSAGNAAPGALASKPLWMGASVKTNVILALDDSGSMAWEMIFPADQGRLTLNSSTGSFFNASGLGFNYNNSGSDEFNVVSPWLGGLEVPPIDAYGFARSPDYNGMYYNPNEIYKPWPIYGTYKPTKGPFDGQTLTKFPEANITDSSGVYRGPFNSTKEKLFETISDSFSTAEGMVYDDNGNKRTSDGGVTYNWQIGTYYLKKTTGTYLYDAGGGTASVTNTENSVLIEAESGTVSGDMTKYSSCGSCSVGYVGTEDDGDISSSSPPSSDEVVLGFTSPGTTVDIWLRVWAPDGSADSLWMKVDGKGAADFSAWNGDEVWSGGYEKFWENIEGGNNWVWRKWGTMSNLTEDGSHTLRIKRREDGLFIDQVLITTEDTTPDGIVTLSPPVEPGGVTRSCNPETIAGEGVNGLTYHDDFRLRNGSFSAITDGANTYTLGGIGPDGACLVKYVIPQTGTFANGATNTDAIGRTLAEEQQNFANWFMYYRRRFYAMQGGVANALDGVGNVRVGLFGINNQANVTMWDLDEASDQGSFLTKHYDDYSASGGTNLRSSLKYAGEQFKRYDSGAPIISECQKNYTLLFSDGFNTTLSYSGVGNEDGGKGAPFEDTYSGTLGDIAYKYYNTKLRTGAAFPEGAVQVSKECTDGTAPDSEDCNTNLHMNTYTVGFGLEGTIYDKDVPGVTGKKFDSRDNAHTYKDKITWPNVTTGVADERQVDDMYHAAVNGFGETYSATSPTELRTKLKNALDDIIAKSGSGSGVTFNSSSLSSTGDVGVYFTSFNAANWTGNLAARGLVKETAGTAVAGDLAPDIAWKAANILDARDITGAGLRSIYTYNGTAGVVFHWDNLTSTQKADLQAGGSVAEGQARLAYFLGNKSNDGSGTTYAFRERASRMGDVVNSTPVYVGAPASNWPETSDFGTGDDAHKKFKKDQENRTPTVWVAANDGMLHGFNAKLDPADGGGKELLAYIPNAVYNASAGDGLSYLTNPSYVHRYYNDLSPVVQDVRINTGVSTAWHSVLVGGLGAGGKGIYALDVTNPSLFTNTGPTDANAAKVVLWEFDSTDDSDLGYLVTPPSIAKMNDGSWAAVFGNGYNSTTGNTALFIVRIEEGVDGVWAAGDYTKIVLPTSASVDGLSGVSLADLDGDRIVDRIYGGDLHGNLWVFNVSSDTASNWDVAYTTGGGATKVPLYKAINADGVAQPITAAPNLAYNTETTKAGNEPNVLVGFGTGQYLSLGDNTNKEVQSFYIVWDRGSTGTTNTGLVRDDLVQRKLVFDEAAYENHGKITISSDTDDAIDWNATTDLKYGWYVDFIVGSTKYGERLITKPIFRSSKNEGIVAVFITRIPNTDSACSGGGKSSLYAMPILTGLAPTEPIVDLDGDGEIDTSSEFGVGREFGEMYDDPNMLSDNIYAACSVGENCVDTTVTNFGDVSVRTGRLGWHELINE
jgi:type IV pilus assembly protein PilY1